MPTNPALLNIIAPISLEFKANITIVGGVIGRSGKYKCLRIIVILRYPTV
jgi:hypothetical protein